MDIRTRVAVDREDKSQPQPWLHAPDGFEINTKCDIPKQTVTSGVILVHLRFTF